MKLLVLLCCFLSTVVAVPVRRSVGLSSEERRPILISQGPPVFPPLPGFAQLPQLPGSMPFTQVAVPQQAAQYAPWNRFPELYNNFYGFPIGGMPPPVGGMPPPVGGMPPPVGGMPPPVGGMPPPVGGMPPPLGK
ncbi:proline-rich protein 2-like isoform X2 [Eublepharis macularius]|nr:proline-rich protein 2-like isoform X2 [Eublepharis macularius]